MNIELKINRKEKEYTKQENEFIEHFEEKLNNFVNLFVAKDKKYKHAWRAMPWQSCLIRSREKLQRLLLNPKININDIMEEIGDSVNYLIFAIYQFENSFDLDFFQGDKKKVMDLFKEATDMLRKSEGSFK